MLEGGLVDLRQIHILSDDQGVLDALRHFGHLREQCVQRPRERRIATACEASEGLPHLLDPVIDPRKLGAELLVVLPELQKLCVRTGPDVRNVDLRTRLDDQRAPVVDHDHIAGVVAVGVAERVVQ